MYDTVKEKFVCRTLASRLFAYYRRGKGMQVLPPMCLDKGEKKKNRNVMIQLNKSLVIVRSPRASLHTRGEVKTYVKILKGTMYSR